MTRDEVLRDLAEIMHGLAVPNSIDGPRLLGTAHEPWQRLYHEAFGLGYPTRGEWNEWLKRTLTTDPTAPSD